MIAIETDHDGFALSDDPARFDLARAHGWIAGESYWAEGIPLATFEKAVADSLVVGAYAPAGDDGRHGAGGHRPGDLRLDLRRVRRPGPPRQWPRQGADGLSAAHPDLQGLRRLHLATRDAHGLYAQFGFGPLTGVDRWMEIRDRDVYRG